MTRGQLDLSGHKHAKRTMPTRSRAYKPQRPGKQYGEIWRMVDGAVRDAFASHPEYVQQSYLRSARLSITKRVTGAVNGYVASATKGREAAPETAHGNSYPGASTWTPLGAARVWVAALASRFLRGQK